MTVQQITPKIEQKRQQIKLINKHPENISQNNSRQDVSFGNAGMALYAAPAVFLRFLDTNQAWGANLVDLGSMVIPRTAYDMKNRGIPTGMETLRRESTGTANHASVGVYGTVLGAALALGLNNTYGVKAHKIFANNDTLHILGEKWHTAVHSAEADPLKSYLNDVISNIKVYNPTATENVNGLVDINKDTQEKVVERLYNLIKDNKAKETIKAEDVDYIKRLITAATGGEKSVVLNGEKIVADNTLTTLIENIHNVTKAFNKEKVLKSFTDNADLKDVDVLKGLKSLNIKRSVAGLGMAAAIGMSVQPINMYLTKKKTGIDGFPGVPGRKKDKSTEFNILKSIMAVVFAAGAISTIMIGDKKSAAKELSKASQTAGEKLKDFGNRFLSKIQFKGMMPTINQLKFVYGMTIMSRFMCARDKDELRESAVKDSLGFLNLLVLGALVTKGASRLLNKDLINLQKDAGKGFINWMKSSSVKSRDEILLEALGKNGIDVVKDGKALSYGKLLREIKNLPDAERKDIWKKLVSLDIAQLIGYAYSGIFLGYYLPKINASMSAANEEKRIARVAKAEGKTIEQVKAEMAAEMKKLEEQMAAKEAAKKNKKLKTQPVGVAEVQPQPVSSNVLNTQINSFKSAHIE